MDQVSKNGVGIVYLVGAGPGDPGLLTLRAKAILEQADVVLHDELVNRKILRFIPSSAMVKSVGKRGTGACVRNIKQSEIDEALISYARQGKKVVRLKGGDPYLFGRGSEEAEALWKEGIAFEVIPGIASPLGVSSYAGIPLTHRDYASSVVFVSARLRDGRSFDFEQLKNYRGTICILMGARRMADVARDLIEKAQCNPTLPCAIVSSATLPAQRVVEGTLHDIASRLQNTVLEGPALIVVGEVVRLRPMLRAFERLPLFGKRVLIPRARAQAEETAALLETRGADPIIFPVIEMVAPKDRFAVKRAIETLFTYDTIVFTSENGVAWFWRYLEESGKDARVFGSSRIAAIGSSTAAALQHRGIRADVVPEVFRGEELAQAIVSDVSSRHPDGSSAKILILRALKAREALPEMLQQHGHVVDVVPVYETVFPSQSEAGFLLDKLRKREVDIVLFTSSSTVEHLCEQLGEEAKKLLQNCTIASIGSVTSATAKNLGLHVHVTAKESTMIGLLNELEKYFS